MSCEKTQKDKKRILVTGASGFIGSRLVKKLEEGSNYHLTCMTRNIDSLKNYSQNRNYNIDVVQADVQNYEDLVKAMNGIDVAFYLIHSMEGSTSKWKKFAERDRIAAENFARAATECKVKRIIYLGGLTHAKHEEMSEHMYSRKEVGKILMKSESKVTIFQAAVILGQGGGSFQMLQYLVERLPLMICPKWVLTRSQPIAVDDVVEYLINSIEVNGTEEKTFEIGGPEILSYLDMMKRYATMLNKSIKIVIIPFLTPRLSSYWVDLITPVKASLARPLIDSLKHEATIKDHSIDNIIPIKLKRFEESIEIAMYEQVKKNSTIRKEHTSSSLNNKILIFSLIALSILGSTYYLLDAKNEIFRPVWLFLSGLWYFGILFSLYFVTKKTRLGSMVAGIIGWVTLAFWLLNNFYSVFGTSVIDPPTGSIIMLRNIIGTIMAGLVIASAHNIFHKLRVHGL